MISCRCAEVSDGGVSVVEAEHEAAARVASRSVLPASSSAAVGVAGGVVPRRLFVQGRCVEELQGDRSRVLVVCNRYVLGVCFDVQSSGKLT